MTNCNSPTVDSVSPATPPTRRLALLDRFRRITSGGAYIPEIDGVRGLAILFVFAFHLHERVLRRFTGDAERVTNSAFHFLISSGGVGVCIFFALSGYILYKMLSRPLRFGSRIELKSYFWRRVTRLEPPYIVVTTVLFLVLTFSGYQSGGKLLSQPLHSPLASYAATIGYLHTLVFGHPPAFNPPGWSLEVEVQFYILAPLMALGLLWLRSGIVRCALVGAIICIWPFCCHQSLTLDSPWRFTIVAALPYFLVGVLICEFLERATTIASSARRRWLIDVCAAVGLCSLFFIKTNYFGSSLAQLLQCAAIGVFLLGALRGDWVRTRLAHPLLALLGGMCYTLYLIHVPIVEVITAFTTKLLPQMSYTFVFLVEAGLTVPVVLLVGGVAYLLVEQPCMKKNWPIAAYQHMRSLFFRCFPSNVLPAVSDEPTV